jgi:hypothetical protein
MRAMYKIGIVGYSVSGECGGGKGTGGKGRERRGVKGEGRRRE